MEELNLTQVNYPPLRGLDEFILGSAKFQIPNLKDLDKWGNRVVQNLLYYQTNYFFMAFVIFLIVGYMHPGKIIMGSLATVVLTGVFVYFSMEGKAVHNFKKKYPWIGLVVVIFSGCFVTYTLGSMLVFLIGILLPFCAIFVHASFRLRNIRNKIVNKIEGLGLKRTPMGIFLEWLGTDQEMFA